MKPLLWIFQFVFGCRHRHLSRVFTIKHRTYKVCFDCGQEFDLPDPHAPLEFSVPSQAGLETRPLMHTELLARRSSR
jgi:hypothetical protein